MGRHAVPLDDRLMSMVVHVDECWLWLGSARKGYPQVKVGRRTRQAHRVAHEVWIGPISDGYEVDHLCFHPLCINPHHLEAVTPEENQRRASVAGRFSLGNTNIQKTECKRGHPLSGDNLRVVEWRGQVMRQCVACKRIHNRARYIKLDA